MSDFRRLAYFDEKDLVGARWWQEHLAAVVGRRDSLRSLSYLAVALLGVGAAAKIVAACSGARSGSSSAKGVAGDDDLNVTKDAIDLQQTDGWDVGRAGEALTFTSSSPTDIDGKASDPSALAALPLDMTPTQAGLVPYYVPTLFQWGAKLHEGGGAPVSPMHSSDMDRAFSQGSAFASLFNGLPKETAVIVDMPGPQAVAFAAGMAESFEPVFTFDNWPHPVGVVLSHNTLAATLFYAPMLTRLSRSRVNTKPPVFVLDSNRLAPYTDDKSQFDNRYLAKLPTKDNFASLGIKHLLYVTDGAYKESDDLNDDFVAFKSAGLGPKMVDRGDFTSSEDAVTPDAGQRNAENPPHSSPHYYYGGYPHTHYYFWHSYGWYTPSYTHTARAPAYVSTGHAYQPAPRTTMFSSSTGRTRPGGFGRVSVTTSRQSGHVTSTSYGGRSGSLGRSGSGSSGYSG